MDIAFNTYSIRKLWNILKMDGKAIETVIAICNDLGISKIEFLDQHFEKDQLKDNCKQFADAGIEVFAIGPHVHLLVKPNEVEKNVKEGIEWLNLAHDAGVKFVRFQVGDGPMPRAFAPMNDFDDEEWEDYREAMGDAVNFSKPVVNPLVEKAEKLDVTIGIETHHSYSSNYIYMELYEKEWQSKNMGWIFDIGNYENDEMRWKALDVIKGNTSYIHAKAYDFNEKGYELKLDYPKACKILWDAGFRGNWSIEFEGNMNGILGAMKSNELIKHSIAAVKGESYAMKTDFPSEDDLMEKYLD
ncbi:MAG: sugar phosphate isomerase/epimerase family protein [Candidatus Hodarchaeota archaeon]